MQNRDGRGRFSESGGTDARHEKWQQAKQRAVDQQERRADGTKLSRAVAELRRRYGGK